MIFMISASTTLLAASLFVLTLHGTPAPATDGKGAATTRCFKIATPGDPDRWEGRREGEDCIAGPNRDPSPITYIAPELYRPEVKAAPGKKRINCYKLATPQDPTLGAGYFLNGNCLLERIDPAR